MKNRQQHNKHGFTLLEMVISIGLFSVLIISTISIMIGVSKAQAKTANIQAIQDNIRFGLELITRELRTGTNYRLIVNCGSSGNGLQFTSVNQGVSQERFYYYSDTDGDAIPDSIMRVAMATAGGIDCTKSRPLTAEEVIVERLEFIVRGTAAGPGDGQPRATVSMSLRAKNPRIGTDTSMSLQTTVTQRLRDL